MSYLLPLLLITVNDIVTDAHKDIKYLVDFDPVLAEIITETKYMEQLGFGVPELARNVALQVSVKDSHISQNNGIKCP